MCLILPQKGSSVLYGLEQLMMHQVYHGVLTSISSYFSYKKQKKSKLDLFCSISYVPNYLTFFTRSYNKFPTNLRKLEKPYDSSKPA